MRAARRLRCLSALTAGLSACSTVEYTNRSRVALIPGSVMNSLGAQAYVEAGGQYPECQDPAKRALIEKVGRRIAAGVERDYQWEFKLFEADIVNAWCLPGGKVGFFTGILPICQNEDGIAAVMGHEIAHAFAEHGNERMTQGLGVQAVELIAEVALSRQSAETKEMVMGALGAGAQLGFVLPFSRAHESEADEIGLRFMVRAGYNPEESVKLWERMARLGEGKEPPKWQSTHPPSRERAERLRELIPRIVAEEAATRARAPGAPKSIRPVDAGRKDT